MKITKVEQSGIAGRMAGVVPSTGVWYDDTGGDFGGGTLTVAEILALIAAGLAPNAFYLRRQGGGSDTQDLGTLGASPVADLANASVFLGELDQDASITVVGFLPAGRRSEGAFAITEDGTGGWTPTFTGFTWIGGTPTWDTTAGTVTHVVFFSDDGGTTIYAAVVGGSGGGSGSFPGDVVALGAMGATPTLDYAAGTAYTGTLDTNATVDFAGFTAGKDQGITFLVSEDGTGGHTLAFTGVTWLGGVTPTHDDTASTSEVYAFLSFDGGTTIIGGQLGASAGTVTAAQVAALGFMGPILMTDGISSPPEPLWTEDGTDYLYQDMG